VAGLGYGGSMKMTSIDPQLSAYSQAVLATNVTRLLFISGQVPETRDGGDPDGFDEQCRVAWRNVLAGLGKAEIGIYDPSWLIEIEAVAAA
jgi:2-iminobutanoate/2-iminopropanoate deaminase